MNTDTENFLESLLWADFNEKPWTIHEFHPEFIKATDDFISGFRTYLAAKLPDTDPDDCERSFGGNVYFSLSGHGCGFWDDSDMELGKALNDALVEYSGGKYAFEQIDLMKFHGKIHLAYRTAEYRREYLAKMFNTTQQPVTA